MLSIFNFSPPHRKQSICLLLVRSEVRRTGAVIALGIHRAFCESIVNVTRHVRSFGTGKSISARYKESTTGITLPHLTEVLRLFICYCFCIHKFLTDCPVHHSPCPLRLFTGLPFLPAPLKPLFFLTKSVNAFPDALHYEILIQTFVHIAAIFSNRRHSVRVVVIVSKSPGKLRHFHFTRFGITNLGKLLYFKRSQKPIVSLHMFMCGDGSHACQHSLPIPRRVA